jgi:hypothetical protein
MKEGVVIATESENSTSFAKHAFEQNTDRGNGLAEYGHFVGFHGSGPSLKK